VVLKIRGRSFLWFRASIAAAAVAVSAFFFARGGFEFDSTVPGLGLTLLPFIVYVALYRIPSLIGYVVGLLLLAVLTALIVFLSTAEEPTTTGYFAILLFLVIAVPTVLLGAVVDYLQRRGHLVDR
jgi:hypothetical protein